MAIRNSIIETGVDKLVDLIRERKKISVKDAAKELGVGPIVAEEWADFLEEEEIISIEYKFATPFLVEKKLTKDEIKGKEKEFHSKKEGFIRKAEVTLAILDREGEDFNKFKDKFNKLKKEIGFELGSVISEIKELEKLENLKKSVDQQIDEQEKDFYNKMLAYENKMKKEEGKYKEIVSSINSEQEKLDRERLETISLREREMDIRKRLKQFQENISEINKAIDKEEIMINDSEKRVKLLKNVAEKVKEEVSNNRGISKELNKQKESHKKKIEGMRSKIIDKVSKNDGELTRKIEEGKISGRKFKDFFDKKMKIEKLIKDMDKQKDQLEYELIELVKKAKAFHLSSCSGGLKGHVKELEETFEKVKKQKVKFESEATKLSSLLK